MKARGLFAVTVLGLVALAACSNEPETPKSFDVQVGAEDLAQALSIDAFMPKNVTLNVGDTVVFTKKTVEPHTVTINPPNPLPAPFLPAPDGRLEGNPALFFSDPPSQIPPAAPGSPTLWEASVNGTQLVHSGFLQGPSDVVKIAFLKAGTYQYVCEIHPTMKGTITVNASGKKYAKSAADYQKDAADQLSKQKSTGKTFRESIKIPAPASEGGNRNHTVYAGAGDATNSNDFYGFIGGENLAVKVGDKVTWTLEKNDPGVPHTVTFLSGAAQPELVVPEPQPNGPPKLVVNPLALAPAPAQPAPYAGTGYVNSGLMLTGSPGPQAFSLTFSKPGTYKYLCILHDPNGMNGTITVTQ